MKGNTNTLPCALLPILYAWNLKADSWAKTCVTEGMLYFGYSNS